MNDHQAAITGKTLTVQLQGGQSETITVQQFTMKDATRVLDAYPNMIRVSELACRNDVGPVPPKWADMLTVRSFADVLDAVEEVNADFFDVCRRLNAPIAQIMGMSPQPTKPTKPGP